MGKKSKLPMGANKQIDLIVKDLPIYPRIDINGNWVIERKRVLGKTLLDEAAKLKSPTPQTEHFNKQNNKDIEPDRFYLMHYTPVTDPRKIFIDHLKKYGATGIPNLMQEYLDNYKKVIEKITKENELPEKTQAAI